MFEIYQELTKAFISFAVKEEYVDLIQPADIENIAHELNGDEELVAIIYDKIMRQVINVLEEKTGE